MAMVFAATLLGPRGFSKRVAIKVAGRHVAVDPRRLRMFIDEARIAAKLRHPNIVSTLDLTTIEGTPAIVMELVEGLTLAQLRAVRGAVPAPIAVSAVYGVLLGLHHAHEMRDERGQSMNIVHRDVSPQNIILGGDGVARLTDFGIATAARRLEQTQAGELRAKLGYAAPEQLRQGSVDRRADVYGASVVLWELLTGERWLENLTLADALNRVESREFIPPSSVCPEVPAGLDAILCRGMSRSPRQRYPSAQAMADALERAMAPASPRAVVRYLAGHFPQASRSPLPVSGSTRLAMAERPTARVSVNSELLSLCVPQPGRPTVPLPRTIPDHPPPRSSLGPGAQPAEVRDTVRDARPPFDPVKANERIGQSAPTGVPRRRWPAYAVLAMLVPVGFVVVRTVISLASPVSALRGAHEPMGKELVAQSASVDTVRRLVDPAIPPSTPATEPGEPVRPRQKASAGRAAAVRTRRAPAATVRAATAMPTAVAPLVQRCVPPYEVDARGIRAFKSQCLTADAVAANQGIVDPWQ